MRSIQDACLTPSYLINNGTFNNVRKALVIGSTTYYSEWNTVMLGADGSALEILLELTKRGSVMQKTPQGL